ncbi:chloride channel protein [Spiribacter vilamensis]|nr:chloride channel protein [Spiribacter vilamensis]TVO61342.1 chloride channel protein [Spiribacter vilamensis]
MRTTPSQSQQYRLSIGRAPVLMAGLGVAVGALTALVVICFRLLYESGQSALLPGGVLGNYEALTAWQRLLLPIAGAGLIGVYMRYAARGDPRTGIGFVIERTTYYEALLPLRNAINQLVVATIAIVSGHSVGREGPSVHLGATAGSQVGQWLGLPHNSLRTLVACGTAAAIGASFDTPLAGVAFAMEVVVMEYTIAGFLPVIIAGVTATALARVVFGSGIVFSIPALSIEGLHELPLVLVLGLLLGGLAAAFIRLLRIMGQVLIHWPVVTRTLIGGSIVGTIGLFVPEVMGIGYDTVAATLAGELGVLLLVAIVIAKLLATAAIIGLGVPGGIIGPTLVMGAAAGGAMGLVAESMIAAPLGGPALYALLGMGAMMGATLRAPLAALTAMLELTANPGIIMPGMLTIAAATLSAREIFRTDSVYHLALGERGLDPRRNPLLQAASRLGILQLVDPHCRQLAAPGDVETIETLLTDPPNWILHAAGEEGLPTRIGDPDTLLDNHHAGRPPSDGSIPLLAIDEKASLREAVEQLREAGEAALLVTRPIGNGAREWRGVVTRASIYRAYLG